MTELELAQRTADVMEIMAYIGFILWGGAGWYVGRSLLRKNYIKPRGLINMAVVRQIEDDNFNKNEEINELNKQIVHYDMENDRLSKTNAILEDHNKRLHYWHNAPHRDAAYIEVKQLDEDGDLVAHSSSILPEKEKWVEPLFYADEEAKPYHEFLKEKE